ncbi:primase-helicase zinc-binding domain-containing protein [Moraxella catarrhalis]|uniref:primase-helicase zinc-binding domain-containing protein n=1 Tax=Moraxella catarrhalis TaxID=480 RepID=UPI0011C4DF6E|nr:primase-helicase zinc-binding domain-containing protein [Moraxella catarrhalis]
MLLGYDVGDGRHKPCPHCGGRDRFRFDNHNIQAGDGGWICSQGIGETTGGDGLSFLMDHVSMQPKDALTKEI